MANPFDRFDAGGNPFDQFDAPAVKADPKIGQPEELTFAEKYIAPLLERAGVSEQGMAGKLGVSRGGAVGRLAMGAADPGVAVAQLAANAVGQGEGVNKRIQEVEQQYQSARGGSAGTFDPLRMAGQVGISTLVPGATAAGSGVVRGALMGGAFGAANPVSDGAQGADFWKEKGKQALGGAVGGAVLSPLAGAVARVISPNASTNAERALLRSEGVDQLSVGQTLGGAANAIEEKAQNLPFVGSMIEKARQRGTDQLESAGWRRVGEPIGATIEGRGHAGVKEAADKIGAEYEKVLPKMAVNVLDEEFLGRMGSLRAMVQTLPQREREQFDAVLAREIDGRLTPNGTLGGQALKDAWIALREQGKKFSRSQDGYQQDLGQAFRQAFQELKDHVGATNNASNVSALKNADFAWANFKRMQRAASSVAAEGGRPSPAQMHSAVKALDSSKDKARFAEGDALMQDLTSAGKSVLTNKVPDSGTAGRGLLGWLALGGAATVQPATIAGMGLGAAAYTPAGQNILREMILRRPEAAPAVANYLRMLASPAAVAGAPMFARAANDR